MEDKYCVLIKPKKYIELRDYDRYTIKPLQEDKQNDYEKGVVRTIYNLPYEITNNIDEDIKIVSKEEYEKYKAESIRDYEEFMKTYVSDLDFINGE